MDPLGGSIYDPELLGKFHGFISKFEKNNKGSSHIIGAEDLRSGMYLDQDIILSNGLLLIPGGVLLDSVMIGKIQSFPTNLFHKNQIRVIY